MHSNGVSLHSGFQHKYKYLISKTLFKLWAMEAFLISWVHVHTPAMSQLNPGWRESSILFFPVSTILAFFFFSGKVEDHVRKLDETLDGVQFST